MTSEQYEFIISIFSEKIKAQEKEITLQKWQIESLQKQLEQAEALLPTKTTREIV